MFQTDDVQEVKSELMPAGNSALEAINRAEVDIQISTAHKFPRSIAKFNQKASDIISQDADVAASCLYARPVGRDPETGKQKIAEGESIRMAEIVAACYGNLRVGAIITEQTPREVVARGMAHDLESNFATSVEVKESTVTKKGQPYSERQAAVVAKVALSKAYRDAIFKVVPRAFVKNLRLMAEQTASGGGKTLAQRREAAVEYFVKMGVDKKRIFASLGDHIKGVEDMGSEEVGTLLGVAQAIREGDTTAEEAFPPLESPKSPPSSPPPASKKAGKAAQSEAKPKSDPTPAGKPKEPAEAKQEASMEPEAPHNGGAAHAAGFDRDKNPFPADATEHGEWNKEWDAAEALS